MFLRRRGGGRGTLLGFFLFFLGRQHLYSILCKEREGGKTRLPSERKGRGTTPGRGKEEKVKFQKRNG